MQATVLLQDVEPMCGSSVDGVGAEELRLCTAQRIGKLQPWEVGCVGSRRESALKRACGEG
jgi:hypothetical protein